MRTSFHHQSEAQPPNGPLTAATSPDTPSTCPATQSVSRKCAARAIVMHRVALDYFPAQNCALGIVGQLKAVRQCPPE